MERRDFKSFGVLKNIALSFPERPLSQTSSRTPSFRSGASDET